jgi:hypothetical protein
VAFFIWHQYFVLETKVLLKLTTCNLMYKNRHRL